jgi:hypothetical protein
MNNAAASIADHTDIANLLRDVVTAMHDFRAELSALRSERQIQAIPPAVQREAYSVDEVARMLGKSPYSVTCPRQ